MSDYFIAYLVLSCGPVTYSLVKFISRVFPHLPRLLVLKIRHNYSVKETILSLVALQPLPATLESGNIKQSHFKSGIL